MRLFLISTFLILSGASAAFAQDSYSGDAAAAYHWVRTNAGPGQCGCFGTNGGGISGSWNVKGPWSIVTDFRRGNYRQRASAGQLTYPFLLSRRAIQNSPAFVGRKS